MSPGEASDAAAFPSELSQPSTWGRECRDVHFWQLQLPFAGAASELRQPVDVVFDVVGDVVGDGHSRGGRSNNKRHHDKPPLIKQVPV